VVDGVDPVVGAEIDEQDHELGMQGEDRDPAVVTRRPTRTTVVSVNAAAPRRGVEHQRREVHGPLEVEHVLARHADREHAGPVPRIAQEWTGEDLQPRVVDEARRERRRV